MEMKRSQKSQNNLKKKKKKVGELIVPNFKTSYTKT